MAPVLLKYVVSFSSQDSRYPAEGLLDSDGCKKWLCASGEKSGRLEAEFQMERSCTISHLDIGAQFVFSVQVLVGRSSWPCGKEYVTLLPSSTFLSPADCRLVKNRTVIRMFKKEDFDAAAASEKWDRIRFICCQPFRKDTQFGLSLLRIVSDDDKELTNTLDAVAGQTADDVPSSTMRTSLLSPSATSSPRTGSEKTAQNLSPSLSSLMTKSSFSPLQKSTKEIAKLKALGVTSIEGQYSRAGQLLLAATGQAVRYKPPSTSLPTRSSETPSKDADFKGTPLKRRKTIEDEITEFVNAIDYTKLDLETFTFADLRHQFEKQKFRKLSKEERKVLVAAATKALEAIAKLTDVEEKQVTKESNKMECSKTVSNHRQNVDCSPGVLVTSLGKEQNINNGFVNPLPRHWGSSSGSPMPFVQNKGVKRPSDKELGQSHSACLNSLNTSGLNSDIDHTLHRKEVLQPKRKLVMVEQKMSPANLLKTNQKKNNKKHSYSSKSSSELSAEAFGTGTANTTDDVWLSKSSPIGSGRSPATSKTAHNATSKYAHNATSKNAHNMHISSVNSTMSTHLSLKDQGFEEVEDEVQCPLCTNSYPSDVIAVHASTCSL